MMVGDQFFTASVQYLEISLGRTTISDIVPINLKVDVIVIGLVLILIDFGICIFH